LCAALKLLVPATFLESSCEVMVRKGERKQKNRVNQKERKEKVKDHSDAQHISLEEELRYYLI